MEDAAAFIRSIAERRNRNVDALEATVLRAEAYSADEALSLGIVDIEADTIEDLLESLDGRVVPVHEGEEIISTSDASVTELKLNWIERILAFLSNANLAFLFVSLGGIGLIVELWNPGTVVPGFLGIIFLVLGFAGLGQLPFSWAGVAMIGLAMILFFLEAQAPGFGFFGIAGAVVLVLGGMFLVGFFGAPGLPGAPSFGVSPWVYGSVGGVAGAFILWLAWEIRRSQTTPGYQSPTLTSALVGREGKVTRQLNPTGEVHVSGEYWVAEMERGGTADVGETVVVKSVDGLTLCVGYPSVDGNLTEK
jgi:membrane-bound serine protease (ClpP class)